jgi:hypothetical protein
MNVRVLDERRQAAQRFALRLREAVLDDPSLAALDENLVNAIAHVAAAPAHSAASAFLARALYAIADIAERADEKSLLGVLGASTPFDLLLGILQREDVLPALLDSDPLARARLRGLAIQQEILRAEGPPLTSEEVGERLSISRQAVDKRRQAGGLLGLTTGRRGYLYPAWQFTDHGVLPGLRETLDALDIQDPWARAAFFLGTNSYLDDERPIELLRRNEIAAVIEAARAYGRQGAA